MQEPKHWLEFAKIDLLSAQSLTRDGYFSTAAYHCQQCAEKALKGFLIAHETDLLKTHDLVKLLVLCKKIDQEVITHPLSGRLNICEQPQGLPGLSAL